MEPKDLVERMLDDEPARGLTYELIYPIGEEDVDLIIRYQVEPTTMGDSDHTPGGSRVKIADVTREDTGESILQKLNQDQFYDLLDQTQDHHRAYP